MPWFKVDDNLAFHAKTVAAGNAALGLWVRAGSWCAQNLTDGFLPAHMLPMLGTAPQAARLVKVGLWHEETGGFSFHEWGERQPKREAIEGERAAARERMRELRAQKKARKNTSPQVSGTDSGELPRTEPNEFGNPDPTRPDPTPTSNDVGGTRKRATRLPDDFPITEDMRAWGRENAPGIDAAREHDKFCDYWRGVGGQRGTKLDWVATWRNWMRRAQEDRGLPASTNPETLPPPPSGDLYGNFAGAGA